MRFAILAIAATALLPAAVPAQACFEDVQASAQATPVVAAKPMATADLSAKTKMRKHARKKPKEKVEYMRAVPWQ
jgi:hypothetical protein